MAKQIKDPGLGSKYGPGEKRLMNKDGNENKRKYYRLDLEIDKIEFFPATWTIVHPIDDSSPFNTIDLNNLDKEGFEIVIQLNGFDDTFSQYVHSRYSCQGKEIIVGAKFKPASRVDESGDLIIPLDEFYDNTTHSLKY